MKAEAYVFFFYITIRRKKLTKETLNENKLKPNCIKICKVVHLQMAVHSDDELLKSNNKPR